MMLRALLVLIAFCLTGPSWAAEDAYYIGPRKGVDVLAKARSGSKIVGHLPRKTNVKVLTKRRTWWKVEASLDTGTITGWVPQGALRKVYQRTAKKKSSGFWSNFSSLFGGNKPRKTAVLGVRGLEEGEQIKGSARASKEAVKWMEKLTVGDDEVTQFIEEGDLNP